MKYLITILIIVANLFTTYSQDTIHIPVDYSTIQAGINAANNGDIVLVEDGTYTENINYRGKAITVASWFLVDGDTNHINNTIIDGSQPNYPDSGSVVTFNSGEDTNSVLCGFTITGGTGIYFPGSPSIRVGGGINLLLSGARLKYCHIEYNSVENLGGTASGGGIAVGPPGNTSWLILENCVVRNNTVLGVDDCAGGGITITGNARILNNVIEYNNAESSGGIIFGGGLYMFANNLIPPDWYVIGNTIRYNGALSPTGTDPDGGAGGGLTINGKANSAIVKNNIITHNVVQSNPPTNACLGGGVFLRNCKESMIFSENYIAFNRALDNSICSGAGIAIWTLAGDTSRPFLNNNLIVHNTNADYGGGIFIGGQSGSEKKPILINNTISQNSAIYGGAIYSHVSQPLLINSILWNNGTEIYLSGGQVEVYYSDIEGGWTGTGSNNINVDPFFVDTLYNLADSSMCIGAGIDSIEIGGVWYYCPLIDFEGNPRPNPPGSMPDIGAYESPLDSPTVLGIHYDLTQLPENYLLSQNYPNPFNPSTSIVFGLPEASEVKLKLFNSIGEDVANLFEGYKQAGYHQVEFNAVNLPSGVYFYQLRIGSFIETKKMLLLK